MEQQSFNLEAEPEPEKEPPRRLTWTVSELTGEIHRLISGRFDDVRVTGEISGLKLWSSGHAYFNLKDAGALIRCVIWRTSLRYMKVKPAEGMQVVARGSIEVRAERGEYQMIVSGLELQGIGALMLAFDKLKQRLAEEGLFAADRKRPLPVYPRRIGIVTSPQGSVISDMVSVLTRRWPGIQIRLYPTQVQGEGAVDGVCEGLRYFSGTHWADLIIVGRGGGSLEDLWTFNDESVARAIAASPIPVVSAVGHETDFTIADFVADLRAPTPSAAAELVVRDVEDILERINVSQLRTRRAIGHLLNALSRRLGERGIERATRILQSRLGRQLQRVDELEYAIETSLQQRLVEQRRHLNELQRRLRQQDLRLRLARSKARLVDARRQMVESMQARLSVARFDFAPLAARLGALSPLAILERGYSIVETMDGRVVKEPAQAPLDSDLQIRLSKGRISARVTKSVVD